MESLNNYITERIRVDNIKHPEFPINGNTEEIVDFLKERGFEEIKDLPHLPMYTDYVTVFNNTYKNKCFGVMVDSLSKRNIICFADTSNGRISRKNPLFIWKILDNGTHEYQICYEPAKDDTVNHDKFVDAANKYLNL